MADASTALPPGAEATAVTVAIVPGVGGAKATVYNIPLPPTQAAFAALLARVAVLEAAAAVPTPTPTPSPGTTPGADPVPFTVTDLEALYALALGAAVPTTPGAPYVNGREWAWTAGTATGTTALTAAALASVYAALPSVAPAGAGRAYRNGGTVAFTPGASAATTSWALADWAALYAKLPPSAPAAAGQPYQNARTLAFT